MKISIKKTKTMEFKVKVPIRTDIVLDNKIIEQISDIRYLGCNISFYKNNVSCRYKANCLHVGPGPIGGNALRGGSF